MPYISIVNQAGSLTDAFGLKQVYRFSEEGGFVVSEEMNETNGAPKPERFALYSRVSGKGQEPMRAVAYVRLSGDEAHRARQLLQQQEGIARFANNGGYEVVRWYVDTGSADTGLPELAHLLADATVEKRGFDCVLVWSLSRLSRRRAELARLRRAFNDLGVQVVVAADGVAVVRLSDLLTALNGEEFDAA